MCTQFEIIIPFSVRVPWPLPFQAWPHVPVIWIPLYHRPSVFGSENRTEYGNNIPDLNYGDEKNLNVTVFKWY